MKKLLILPIVFISLFIAFPAQAQYFAFEDKEGYGYEFDDDPLNAGGFGANDMVIKVRPRAARVTLIRPRISFVYEMLKSVEDI